MSRLSTFSLRRRNGNSGANRRGRYADIHIAFKIGRSSINIPYSLTHVCLWIVIQWPTSTSTPPKSPSSSSATPGSVSRRSYRRSHSIHSSNPPSTSPLHSPFLDPPAHISSQPPNPRPPPRPHRIHHPPPLPRPTPPLQHPPLQPPLPLLLLRHLLPDPLHPAPPLLNNPLLLHRHTVVVGERAGVLERSGGAAFWVR